MVYLYRDPPSGKQRTLHVEYVNGSDEDARRCLQPGESIPGTDFGAAGPGRKLREGGGTIRQHSEDLVRGSKVKCAASVLFGVD